MGQIKLQGQASKNLPRLYSKNSIQRVDSNDIAVLKEHGVQISKLKKDEPQKLLAAVAIIVQSVYELVNVGKKISEEAIVMLSKMIIDEYWYLKIDEIEYCLREGIKGKYGKAYDRIDGQVIMLWLKEYDSNEQMSDLYEKKNRDLSDNDRGRNASILEMPEFRERIKEDQNLRGHVEHSSEEKEDHKQAVRDQARRIMEESKK